LTEGLAWPIYCQGRPGVAGQDVFPTETATSEKHMSETFVRVTLKKKEKKKTMEAFCNPEKSRTNDPSGKEKGDLHYRDQRTTVKKGRHRKRSLAQSKVRRQ